MVPLSDPLLVTSVIWLSEPTPVVVFKKKGCPGELTLKTISSPAFTFRVGSKPNWVSLLSVTETLKFVEFWAETENTKVPEGNSVSATGSLDDEFEEVELLSNKGLFETE